MSATPLFIARPSDLPKKSSVIAAQSFTNDAANYYPVLTIHSDDRYGGLIRMTIIAGGTGPLTGLKLTASPVKNGTNPVPILVDGDWNNASSGVVPYTTGSASSIYALAAGAKGHVILNLMAPGEFIVSAKSANATTLAFEIAG